MGKLKGTRSIQLTKNTQGIIVLVCSYARNLRLSHYRKNQDVDLA